MTTSDRTSPTFPRAATHRQPRAVIYLNLNPDHPGPGHDEQQLTERCTTFATWMDIKAVGIFLDTSPFPADEREHWPTAHQLLEDGHAERLITWEELMLGENRSDAQALAEHLRVDHRVQIHEVADVEFQLPQRVGGASLSGPFWRPAGQAAS